MVAGLNGHARPTADPARLARRPEPSLQIVGSTDGREVDLPSLAERGIRLTDRVTGAGGRELTFADDLATTASAADSKLDRLLGRIDHFATTTGLDHEIDPPDRPRHVAGQLDAGAPGNPWRRSTASAR